MSDEEAKIESMVHQGKISRADADSLLAAVRGRERENDGPTPGAAHPGHRFLHIRVDEAGTEGVNLRVPVAFANLGLTTVKHLGSADLTVDGQPAPIDMNKIQDLIADPSFSGELLNLRTDDGTRIILTIE